MSRHFEVANTVARFFGAVDGQAWPELEALMTPTMHLDYASFGRPAADLTPADVVAGWRALLPGFDHTHHLLGNLDVSFEGDRASVRAAVTGTHVLDDTHWVVSGRYEMTVVQHDGRWRLSMLRFLYAYQTGPSSVVEEATRRAAAQAE
jgi:hypothetical protein